VLIGGIFLLVATYFLPILVWAQIILAIVLLLLIGILGISFAVRNDDPKLRATLDDANAYDASVKNTAETLRKRIWLLWLVSILFILAGILLAYVVWTQRAGIRFSLGILEFSAKFIVKHLSLVIVAILCFVLQIITFLVTVWGLLVLHTSGDIDNTITGSPIPKFKYGFGISVLMIIGYITVYWTVIFWNNLSDMICGGRACHYYFKRETGPGVIKTALNVIIYHLGTVAFCSLVLVPCTILQLVFGWFYAMFTDDKPNFIQTCVTKICCCLIYPYQKFINRTSETGLTMAYFTSCNYCPSTKRNHYLNRRVGDRIGGSTGFISFLFKITGMIAIASLNAILWNWLLTKTAYFQKRIENPLVPMFAIWVFGFIVAALFMSIYSTACDAFTMCYLIEVDLDRKASYDELAVIIVSKDGNAYRPL
jgi:hypothetical protein